MVYFGQRFYDPHLRRWLTPDPAEALNHSNLFQYLFNNPYSYQDPDGQFAFAIPLLFWGAELAIPTISACITAIGYGAAAGAVAYGGYRLIEAVNISSYYDAGNVTDLYKGSEVPPYDGKELGTDPTVPPAEGFEWKGRGKPGSGKGSWVKGEQGSREILYPDLNHSPPIGPHWDYESSEFPNGIRLFPDGTWSHK